MKWRKLEYHVSFCFQDTFLDNEDGKQGTDIWIDRSVHRTVMFINVGAKMKKTILLLLSLFVVSCVSGSPTLTQDQMKRLSNIEVYKEGETPTKKYTTISEMSAADCSGAPGGGRVWGDAEKAIQTLKMKAASKNADAIVNTNCGSVPFVNNCWAAKKCDGVAVKWVN